MPFAGLFKHVLTTTVVELVAASGTFLENANACCCVTMQQKHEDLSFTILPSSVRKLQNSKFIAIWNDLEPKFKI